MTKLMGNIQLSKDLENKFPKLSLKGYYEQLPNRVAPKQQLLEEIQRRCDNVTLATVRNWVLYGMRPKKPEHIKTISEITGIREEDLWQD